MLRLRSIERLSLGAQCAESWVLREEDSFTVSRALDWLRLKLAEKESLLVGL